MGIFITVMGCILFGMLGISTGLFVKWVFSEEETETSKIMEGLRQPMWTYNTIIRKRVRKAHYNYPRR